MRPMWAVERWKHHANTPYADLSESEQNSDRKEADKFLAIFKKDEQAIFQAVFRRETKESPLNPADLEKEKTK